jgi:hypothetical protein
MFDLLQELSLSMPFSVSGPKQQVGVSLSPAPTHCWSNLYSGRFHSCTWIAPPASTENCPYRSRPRTAYVPSPYPQFVFLVPAPLPIWPQIPFTTESFDFAFPLSHPSTGSHPITCPTRSRLSPFPSYLSWPASPDVAACPVPRAVNNRNTISTQHSISLLQF